MSKFWEGLGGKLTDQWIATLFTPAFVFWLGGFIAWVAHPGWTSLKVLEMLMNNLTSVAQVVLLIGGLLVVVVSSSAVQRLDLATLRWLEGYWPWWLHWLGDRCARRKYRKMHEKQERFDQLVAKEK